MTKGLLLFFLNDVNTDRAFYILKRIFDSETLILLVSAPWFQSLRPHLAFSASVPIPFRDKNVKYSFNSFPGGLQEGGKKEKKF